MGPLTDDVPKAFLELEGRTLYDRQRAVLAPHVEGTSVVLGYQARHVLEQYDPDEPIYVPNWEAYENAASLLLALAETDDDLIVINGDVLVDRRVVTRLTEAFATRGDDANLVGYVPGLQDEATAIRWDEDGWVSEYGLIEGHRHAGIGILNRRHRERAMDILQRRLDDWYPVVYPETPTRPVAISADRHVEINRPVDLERARQRLATEQVQLT